MELVEVEPRGDEVRIVRLNRPERLNALSIDLAVALDEALATVGRENRVRVVVLTGAGRAFCSGLDLKDYGIIPNVDDLSVHRIASRSMGIYSQLTRRLRAIPQPVVAAVNGPAYGGGLCLALGCDLRIASESAVFNATGIVNGLTSTEMGAGWILPRLIGGANANDLLLTGRRVDAGEALRMGLVSRVVADDAVLDEALSMAASMAAPGMAPGARTTRQFGLSTFMATVFRSLRTIWISSFSCKPAPPVWLSPHRKSRPGRCFRNGRTRGFSAARRSQIAALPTAEGQRGPIRTYFRSNMSVSIILSKCSLMSLSALSASLAIRASKISRCLSTYAAAWAFGKR